MKKWYLVIALITFACAPPLSKATVGSKSDPGESIGTPQSPTVVVTEPCTVVSQDYGALITCPDGTSAPILNGEQVEITPVNDKPKGGKGCKFIVTKEEKYHE